MNALYDYLRKEMSYRQKLRDLEVTNTLRNQYRTEFEHLRRLRLETFMSGFATISAKLKEMYQMITLGKMHVSIDITSSNRCNHIVSQ
jgi:structural maintenance of chromosome 4